MAKNKKGEKKMEKGIIRGIVEDLKEDLKEGEVFTVKGVLCCSFIVLLAGGMLLGMVAFAYDTTPIKTTYTVDGQEEIYTGAFRDVDFNNGIFIFEDGLVVPCHIVERFVWERRSVYSITLKNSRVMAVELIREGWL